MSNDNRRILDPNSNPERVLSIPLKKSDPVYLYRPLRKLVARKYSESDAQKVESILETLNKCRRDMVERLDLSLSMQLDCHVHYLKCLCMVEPLFTHMSSDPDADCDPLIFFWYDAFFSQHEDGVSFQRNKIQLEKASILFNLGAIYSQIGASCDRITALGRHLAKDAFSAASNIFLKLWKKFGKDISATLDLTVLFAESLHHLFYAQASELELRPELNNNNISSTLQKHRSAILFRKVFRAYRRAYYLIRLDSAAYKHVSSYDQTWITHLYQKTIFFQAEFIQRQSSIIPDLPEEYSLVQSCSLDHDAGSVTGKFVRGICCMTSLFQSCPPNLDAEDSVTEKLFEKICRHEYGKQQQIPYLDLVFSEYISFKLFDDGKLVANSWDMPPPYSTNSAILSSLSSLHMLAIPLKKSDPLDLYKPLRDYVALRCSRSEAKRLDGLFEILNKLRIEMQRDDLSLPIHRDCLIRYFKCLCMIEPLFPITSPNPPIFVWYNAFNPQEHSSQHNIHLEKASVLFNLGAVCINISLSCDLTTIQGHCVAMDALNDASYWFYLLSKLEIENAFATIDLSVNCIQMVRKIITTQIADLKENYPHSHSHSDGSSFPDYPVTLHYRKAYDLLNFGPLAENLVQSSIPQFLESKMKTCHVKTGASVVIEQFLSGYCEAQSLLREGYQTSWLYLLSEVGPFKIKDGNLVANHRVNNVGI